MLWNYVVVITELNFTLYWLLHPDISHFSFHVFYRQSGCTF